MSGTRLISFNHLWVSLSYFNEILALVFVFHSTFDVGRSMFDVHFFQSLLGKNNLALMGERAGVRGASDYSFTPHRLP